MNRKNLLLLVIFVITFVLVLISQNILYKLSVSNYSKRKIVLQSSGKQRKLMNKGKFLKILKVKNREFPIYELHRADLYSLKCMEP